MNPKNSYLLNSVAFSWLFILMFLIAPFSAAQEPLTLERSLEIAMENSPEIRSYQLNLERRRELLNAQKAALKSQFSLTLTPITYELGKKFGSYYDPNLREYFSTWYTSENKQSLGIFTISQPIKWTDGNLSLINVLRYDDNFDEIPIAGTITEITNKTYSNNLYLSYRQPIFTYNRTKLALRGLELDLENAAINYAIQKLFLEYQVTQNFFNVYQQKASLEIAKDEYHNREQSYMIIKNKVEAGLDPREELYQAELDLTQSKSDVQNSQVNLENYLDTFKKLIGLSLFDEITVTADISHQPVEVDLQKALDNGLKYRMEIRQREIDIENAKYDLIIAAATNEFKGEINISYGIIGNDEKFKNMYETPTRNQDVSLNLNIPLFDWGAKKSRIKAYDAMITSNELSFDDQQNDIRIEIRRAYRNLRNLVNQIEIAEQNVRNAQLTYDINLERYKNGDLTSMDLNLIQNQLSAAKLNKITALINYKTELLNMKVLSLWDFQKNQRVIHEGVE
jgi:outer membrane protein